MKVCQPSPLDPGPVCELSVSEFHVGTASAWQNMGGPGPDNPPLVKVPPLRLYPAVFKLSALVYVVTFYILKIVFVIAFVLSGP
jgi:hypothetical protein